MSDRSQASWNRCAEEGAPLWPPGGGGDAAVLARLGWGLSWKEAVLPAGSACSVASFGYDPLPGVRKVCECALHNYGQSREAERKPDMGIEWSRCAGEGGLCACPSGEVRFGTGARWISTAAHGSQRAPVACNTSTFGGADPAHGQSKECWCLEGRKPPPGEDAASSARVAVVLLTRRPPDLRSWLLYHLDYMGVERVFVSVEDTPSFDAALSSLSEAHRQRVTVWHSEIAEAVGQDARPLNDYESLQARQVQAMERAKEASMELGIDWLIHIDDDELLYAPVHRTVGDILNAMPSGFQQAYIPNVEAVYDGPATRNCFTESSEVNVNRYTFVAYANGKAAVRVDDGVKPAGPHQWRTPEGVQLSSVHLDTEPFGSPLLVVHYESCPFVRWEDKFWELGNTSPEKVNSIPFAFYRESIQRMELCRGVSGAQSLVEGIKGVGGPAGNIGSDLVKECSQAALEDFWTSWKTKANPRLRLQDLMPIQIPWASILGPA